jgi:Caspase domain
MRKALVVGINFYDYLDPLQGCVHDARAIFARLERNEDGSVNFGQPKLLLGDTKRAAISRQLLRESVRDLFADDSDVALFYFAGHGHIEATGGYLCASDSSTGDDGLALSEVMSFANQSRARSRLIILDSCYSGAAGERNVREGLTEIQEGVTVLTASTSGQYAEEANGGGVFTGLLIDALDGAAANLVGQVTPGGVYAHIDQSLGPWSQRPVFKTNVKRFVALRNVAPPIPLTDLQRITEFFPRAGMEYQLDPSFEPEAPDADAKHTEVFVILQKYNRVNLLVPVGAPHMWHAAMQSKTARLTALGEHYRRLVEEKLI